jgi:hypothetical protein
VAKVKGDPVLRHGELVVPIREWLRSTGRDDLEELGRLTADLSDLYDTSRQLVTQIHTLLRTRPDDPEGVSDVLWDLWGTLHHMAPHAQSGRDAVQALAEEVDAESEESDES